MKLEKAIELEAILKEFNKLCRAKDIISNYDSTVEVKISSFHNHNTKTLVSICLPLNNEDKDKVVSGIDSALQEVRERIDNF